uniref:Tropomodulin n=1 Tax=Calcidiscus leptoporus TaxID=127549 RepID=A0A6U5N7W9_9EUKA|mmetsp:Transcript_5833/g.13587  ORF Transcript_5833/g.13587 Transcript_5833/m.13587 type:complete len:277 (+) Transcript_5833:132-962(+)
MEALGASKPLTTVSTKNYKPPDNSDYYLDGPSTFVAPDYVTPLDPASGERSGYAPGNFPEETTQYFDYFFKGKSADDSKYRVNPLLTQHLLANEPRLTVLNVEGRDLDDKELYPVVRALQNNTTVKEINLARNRMDLAALELAEVLKFNKTVTKVNLFNNNMHAKAITAMAEMLSCNTTITELNLSCNFVRAEAKYLAEALSMNNTLNKLYLDNCQIADEESKILLKALDKSTVKEFRGFNNKCILKPNRQALRAWAPKQQNSMLDNTLLGWAMGK